MISSLLHLVGLRPRVYYTLINFRGGGPRPPWPPPPQYANGIIPTFHSLSHSDVVETSQFVQNSEWDLVKMVVTSNNKTYISQRTYADITYWIMLRRKTLFYMVNLVLPCEFLTIGMQYLKLI